MRATITLPDDVLKFVEIECAKINQTKSRYIAHLLKQQKEFALAGVILSMTPNPATHNDQQNLSVINT